MRGFRPWPPVLALLPLLAVFGACHRAPQRAGPSLERVAPPPSLQIELADELGTEWSIHQLQLYVDGWLRWSGVPERHAGQLVTVSVPKVGKQEVYVRVMLTRSGLTGGALASDRRVLPIEAGTTRIRIRLSGGNPLDRRDVDVDITTH